MAGFKRGKKLTQTFVKLEEGVSYYFEVVNTDVNLDSLDFTSIEVKDLETNENVLLPKYAVFEQLEVGKKYEVIFKGQGKTKENKPFNIYEVYELED
jgi:hypothetical protein